MRTLRPREVKYLSKIAQLEEMLGKKSTGSGLFGDRGGCGSGKPCRAVTEREAGAARAPRREKGVGGRAAMGTRSERG